MRGRAHAKRTLKGLVADLRVRNTFQLNDTIYIQLLKYMPIVRKIIRIIKEYK